MHLLTIRRLQRFLVTSSVLVVVNSLVQAEPAWAQHSTRAKAADSAIPAAALAARTISYDPRTVAAVSTEVRITTVIALPTGEEILDFVCGDRDFWAISGAANVAYVKPARAGSRTDLHLVTAGGTIYSFLLTEVSNTPARKADLKVFIEPLADGSAARAAQRTSASKQIEELQHDLTDAHEALERGAAEKQRAVREAHVRAPLQLRFPYVFDVDRPPFHVLAIYHDDHATYLQLRARELPALYELKDGQPSLIAFTVEQGVYVVPKILDNGYLTLGKKRVTFGRRAEAAR